MHQYVGDDCTETNESELLRFSFEDQFQRHNVVDVDESLNFCLFINSGGIEEFKFVGDLEVRFKYYFFNEEDPDAPVIEKRDNVRKFKIIAQVVNPFDLAFDYQLMNPLIRHLNYEGNSVKKSLVVNEKSMIVMAIDNKSFKILIKSLEVEVDASEDTIKVFRSMKLEGSGDLNQILCWQRENRLRFKC